MNEFKLYSKLKDETPILIRTLCPEDKEYIIDGLNRVSFHSRYLRFFSAGVKLANISFDYLYPINQQKHFAIGAIDLSKGPVYGIGLARYFLVEDEPNTAEIAMIVTDEYQGRGLGTILLNAIVTHAKENEILNLCGYVLTENLAMIHLLRKLNSTCKLYDRFTFRFDIPLGVKSRLLMAS